MSSKAVSAEIQITILDRIEDPAEGWQFLTELKTPLKDSACYKNQAALSYLDTVYKYASLVPFPGLLNWTLPWARICHVANPQVSEELPCEDHRVRLA